MVKILKKYFDDFYIVCALNKTLEIYLQYENYSVCEENQSITRIYFEPFIVNGKQQFGFCVIFSCSITDSYSAGRRAPGF